jgi:hypothetical protein
VPNRESRAPQTQILRPPLRTHFSNPQDMSLMESLPGAIDDGRGSGCWHRARTPSLSLPCAATSLERYLLPTSQRKNSRGLNLPELPCKIVESWGSLPMRLLFAKKVKECPQCESSRVRRSCRRGFLERFLYRILFVWPYRCDACDVRFLGFRRQYAPVRVAAPERP